VERDDVVKYYNSDFNRGHKSSCACCIGTKLDS